MKTTLKINAVKTNDGYVLIAENGEKPEEGYVHPSRRSAYLAASRLYPRSSVWCGKKSHSGFVITI